MKAIFPAPFSLENTQEAFKARALELFAFQYKYNAVYHEFCRLLKKTPQQVQTIEDIPFLPISFFKTHQVITQLPLEPAEAFAEIKPLGKSIDSLFYFTSSGTTGSETSKHFVPDLLLYEASYMAAFEIFYGPVENYCVLALLPAYLEREGSSLIYMAEDLIKKSRHPQSGFYLHDHEALYKTLLDLESKNAPVFLIGVSFALLDFSEKYGMSLKNTIVMETGGMKGRRKEMIREALHEKLGSGFGVSKIHSEYGMTELLSQAYSKGDGIFDTPPWMKILIRDTEDPFNFVGDGKTGGVNVIDFANIHSCAFIATQDLGKTFSDNSFSILGRFDSAAIRGCNLLVP